MNLTKFSTRHVRTTNHSITRARQPQQHSKCLSNSMKKRNWCKKCFLCGRRLNANDSARTIETILPLTYWTLSCPILWKILSETSIRNRQTQAILVPGKAHVCKLFLTDISGLRPPPDKSNKKARDQLGRKKHVTMRSKIKNMIFGHKPHWNFSRLT